MAKSLGPEEMKQIKQELQPQELLVLRDENVDVLLFARTLVKETLDAAETKQQRPVSLFLEWHYPCFQKNIQTILMERHPEKHMQFKSAPWYPIDAYLWAEQHVWAGY